MICFAAMEYAFSCLGTDAYFIHNCACATTYSLVHVWRLVDIFVNGLQIDHLNGFQLICTSNTLILHLIMQLILYLFILDYNTIKSHRYIGEVSQQAVAIGLYECCCTNKTYPKKLRYNIHGYSIDTNIIHPRKTASILRNRDTTKTEGNDFEINSIIQIMHSQLFSILFESYVFVQVLISENSLPNDIVTDARLKKDNIVIKKNIKQYGYHIAKYNGL